MLALDPDVVDPVGVLCRLPARTHCNRASAGLSPAPDLRPRLLRGHLVPPGHGVQLGRGGTAQQRERKDAATSTRRVGGSRCLCAPRR
jgi:hypothetical protein